MIKKIVLKFGKSPDCAPAQIDVTPVTIFVGPNNSGKSKLLSEIFHICTTGQLNQTAVILDQLLFDEFSKEETDAVIKEIKLEPQPNETINLDAILVGKRDVRTQVPEKDLLYVLQNPNQNQQLFAAYFLHYNILFLDAKQRISLIEPKTSGDLQLPPKNSFQTLFSKDELREEVRRIIYDAFEYYFVIDPTAIKQLRIRFADRPPNNPWEERGIHEEAVRYHRSSLPIEQFSDGVKSFTGIITEIIAGDPAILLIDDPEAFLHPSLAFRLGNEIATASLISKKRMLVSTHSADFLMGCIQSGARVNIVRLTYRNETATARILPSNEILYLMRNPLLRSTGVIAGLFYDYVIVTESDADRAFYQEINERLIKYKPDLGISNCLFLNGQNWQTIHTIVKPLRELGIPTAGVVDVDVLASKGQDWTNLLKCGFIPEIEHQSLCDLREAIRRKIDATGKEIKRDGGIGVLSKNDKEAADNLCNQLQEYGLFIIRKGEVESWLPKLGAESHGTKWLIKIFNKMGDDPDSPDYLKPSDTDVWNFIGEMKRWLTSENRKGIPI